MAQGFMSGQSGKKPVGNAVAGDVLSGKTFSNVDELGLTGTIPSKAIQTYTPSTANQVISSGQYLSGNQTILGDADLVAGNILTGKNIFGVAGNLELGKKWASGTGTIPANNSWFSFRSLEFRPSIVLVQNSNYDTYRQMYVDSFGSTLNDYRYRVPGVEGGNTFTIYDDGFKFYTGQYPPNMISTIKWIAFE